jgi:hypothetical protein
MYWTSSSGRLELQITKNQAMTGSHQGQCDSDIEYLLTIPKIKRQVKKWGPEILKRELREYGAWEDHELEDHEANIRRMLWIVCGDIMENSKEKRTL